MMSALFRSEFYTRILGRKHIYLPHAQTAIYESKVKLFLKQGISHQLSRDAVVRFECENSAIDVLVVLTTANFGGFSNFCRYYTRSQMGKSTGYRPTLKPLKEKCILMLQIHLLTIYRYLKYNDISVK